MRVCKNGHNVSGENEYIDPRGKSQCKLCRREAAQRHRDTEGTTYRLKHARFKPKQEKEPTPRKPYPKNRARKSAIDRFFSRVEKGESCWLWVGHTTPDGYGMFSLAKHKQVNAHRWIFTELVGEIPAGLEIDHLCNTRNCVNPAHLEPVSHQENIARGVNRGGYRNHLLIGKFNSAKTHCKNGHEYNEENTYIDTHSGGRRCRACMKAARIKKALLNGS